MAGFVLDRGLQTFDISDPDGTVVGSIRLNPSDLGLAARWAEAGKKIGELTQAPMDTVEAIGSLDEQIKAQIDFAFGSPVSVVLFQGASSLALCADGRLVVENVLDAITPVIQGAQQAAVKASAEHVKGYAKKYQGSNLGLAPGQK